MQDVGRSGPNAAAASAPLSPSALLRLLKDPERYTRFLDPVEDVATSGSDGEPLHGSDPAQGSAARSEREPPEDGDVGRSSTGDDVGADDAGSDDLPGTRSDAPVTTSEDDAPTDPESAAAATTPTTDEKASPEPEEAPGAAPDDAAPGREVPSKEAPSELSPNQQLPKEETGGGAPNPIAANEAALGSEPTGSPSRPTPVVDRPDPRARQPLLGAPASVTRSITVDPDPAVATGYLAHSCDLTVNGGVSTALASPLGICALAEHYAFRRIGGSSVAAFTAAAAAAAELGRTAHLSGDAEVPAPQEPAVLPGFAGLAGLVAWLTGELSSADGGSDGLRDGEQPSRSGGGRPEPRQATRREQWRLARLLQPGDDERAAHRLATALLRPRPRRSAPRWLRVSAAAVAGADRASRIAVLLLWLGAVAGCTGMIVALLRSPTVDPTLATVAAVPLVLTFALAAGFGTMLLVARGVRDVVLQAWDADGWGLVAGMPTAAADSDRPTRRRTARLDRMAGVLTPGDVPPLGAWLADRIDDLAGIPRPDDESGSRDRYALTFGELWLGRLGTRSAADVRALRRAAGDPQHRVVDLLLVTTDLSRRRPVVLPFGSAERPEERPAVPYLFCRDCVVEVLPARVADQMLLMSPAPSDDGLCPRHPGARLHELPEPWDLPVAFAVRLALAVPGVLRAVPLHALAPSSDGVGAPVQAHWFCDGSAAGGIASHYFDTALPRWPTFAFTTDVGATDDAAAGAGGLLLPEQDAGAQPMPSRPVSGAGGLAGAVVGVVTGWRDGLRLEAPGIRGRVARIRAADGVGVFVPQPRLLALALRGHHAGVALRERFIGPDGEITGQTQTDRFRWARLRAALREYRQLSLSIGARIPLYTDLALQYRVPASVTSWFSPPLTPGSADPAWGDAVAAVTHLRSLADGGVLDWDTEWGAPPADRDLDLTD